MKLIDKSVISRFSNESYSMESFMDLMGRQPEHIKGFVRLKKENELGLLAITELLGNVYEEDMAYSRFKEISTYAFTWDIQTTQIPTIRITRDNSNDGTSGEFVIYTDSAYFAKYDVAAFENNQQVYFVTPPQRVSDNEYKNTVVLHGSASLQTTATTKNKTLRYVYNLHPEYSEYGTNKSEYNMERHVNYMMKIRAGQKYSSDFRATQDLYLMSDADYNSLKTKGTSAKGLKIYALPSIEQQVMQHFLRSANGALLFGRSSMDEATGRPNTFIDGQSIIAGDGIIAQYERYAHNIRYNKLSVKNFRDALSYIRDKRNMTQGNHITVLCNRKFSDHKAAALEAAINSFAPQNNGTWFFTKDDPLKGMSDVYGGMSRLKRTKVPNEVAVGATFNTYIYDGNTITFVVDEALTQHYPDRGYALFIDTGAYEDENGETPALSIKTLKGRSMVEGYVSGMGGRTGTKSGDVSTALDASQYEIVGWRGIQVKNPYGAVIISQNS